MTKTILLADDSVTIRKVVELTIMDEPYDLKAVGSGTEALENLDDSVDLVIADVHMPGSDGYEVCRTAKERYPGMPVLLLVGTFESFDEGAASAAGADGHLKKPFDSQDLLNRVRELLKRTQAEGEAAAAGAGASGVSDSPPVADPEVSEAVVAPAETEAVAGVAGSNGSQELSDESVARIARQVVELLSEEAVREVAWEVIPDLAEVVIKERLAELEGEVE